MPDTTVQSSPAVLRLMGGFKLCAADGAPVDISNRRARALLAYLHLASDRSARRERLCGLLWSDRAETQARASLRQCLFELRDGLSAAGLDLLDVGRERITAPAQALASDVTALEDALAAHDAPAAVAALPGLMAGGRLLEGMELGGLFQDWLDQARAAFEQALAASIQDLLVKLEAQGRWPEVRAIAEAFLQRDPMHEAVAAAAIRADAATGNPAAAHRRFQALKTAFAREFGAAPGAVVQAAMAGLSASASPSAPTPAPSRPQPGPEAPAKPVLAVLAFDNLSGDAEMDYFSDGVSEEILQTVSRTSALKVIARSSSFQFRGADKAAVQVAAQLGATHLLDGAVRRAGPRVRISAQLVDCASQTTLWSDRFDRDLSDVFALQDEIAQAVSAALQVAFAPSGSVEPVDPLAYELYLRARKLEVESKSAQMRIELLEQAVARAPRFAAAWAALCQARVSQARHGPRPRPFVELKAGVMQAADTALALDPGAGQAYASLSQLRPWGDYVQRETLLQKAVSVAADEAATLALMGAFCNHVGRIREALGYLRRAYELDPFYPLTADIYGAVLGAAGDPDAQALYDSWRLRWPEHLTFTLGPLNAAMFEGDWARFDARLPPASADGEDPSLHATLSIARALREGDPELRPRLTRRLERSIAQTGAFPLHLLATVSAVGMTEEAFAAIDRAAYDFMFEEEGMEPASVYNPGIIFDPQFCAPLMRDIRFVGLCAKLGLCSYWTATDRWPDCAEAPGLGYDFKAEARRLAGS
jgi:adenylate cyclase